MEDGFAANNDISGTFLVLILPSLFSVSSIWIIIGLFSESFAFKWLPPLLDILLVKGEFSFIIKIIKLIHAG